MTDPKNDENLAAVEAPVPTADAEPPPRDPDAVSGSPDPDVEPPQLPIAAESAALTVAEHDSTADVDEAATPRELPLLPLRTDVPFPRIIMPLVVGREKGILLLDDVLKGNKIVGLVTQRNSEVEDPSFDELFPTLCIALVLKMLRFPDGSTRIVAQGLKRARLLEITRTDPYMIGRVEPFDDVVEEGVETDALLLSAERLFGKLVESGSAVSEELQVAAMNTKGAAAYADLLASGLGFSTEEKQELLAEADVRLRLRRLTHLLKHQVEMQDLSSKIQGEVSSELTRAQREQFLRQQLEAIRRELGESEEDLSELNEFYQKLDALQLPEQADKEARRELDRMAQMHPSSPEFHVIRTFLDTLLSMPWRQETEDRLDIKRAKRILDEDHYDLVKVKERILEYLSVRKLKREMRGPILCFVGPPGVGKTSLGKSIARTMDRKFIRVSLGGVHDEAEIRGHRRTYIGAMPGRIIQGLRRLGTRNPVFMLDEIDKLASDYRGDPSSALLEVLDPEQNHSFRDHYFDVEFDLSRVLFICTANNLATIPSALLDRMEVIELSGYSEEEKLVIARRYLIPKQLEDHGLTEKWASFTDDAIRTIVRHYTHEAGLRNLEREIAAVCRKIARNYAEGNRRRVKVDAKRIASFLGAPRFLPEPIDERQEIGTANGLAWTPVGGERLTIESIKAPSPKHGLKLTGSLGEVMKESAHAALGYLRAHANELKIDKSFFDDYELHIHVPAGAISKDGPSAGIAMTASLLSLAKNRPLRPGLAMTGEITLTGRILPVGGIHEKLLAARREGLPIVILPFPNEKDTENLPKEARKDLTFIFVRHMDEVIPHLFSDEPTVRRRRTRAKVVSGRSSSPRPKPARPRPGRPAQPPRSV